MLKTINDAEVIPRFYGVAYYRYDLRVAVCAPMPLNWLLGWGRKAWWYLAHGPRQEYMQKALERMREDEKTGFHHGYLDGLKEAGLDAKAAKELIRRPEKI